MVASFVVFDGLAGGGVMGAKGYPVEVREVFFAARVEGLSNAAACRLIGVPACTGLKWWSDSERLRSARRTGRSVRALTLADRELIRVGLVQGLSAAGIGRLIGRHRSVVVREVAANQGREGYVIVAAERRAVALRERPKVSKLVACRRLRAYVIWGLRKDWSPQKIARRVVVDFPDDADMRISHETIYQALFVQSRGLLRANLTRHLASRRVKRTPRTTRAAQSTRAVRDMIMISERPAEVNDRVVPGHWEGDLIVGKNGKSYVGTLVERSTRFVMLLHLPEGPSTEHVISQMQHKIVTLPETLKRSITWDQGSEMAGHKAFSIRTGIPIYFCDPRSPWQRGTNENTNGLLRRYLPKSSDLNAFTEADLDAIAHKLNGRPRETLQMMTPYEAFNTIVALTV